MERQVGRKQVRRPGKPRSPAPSSRAGLRSGFTLVEVLVAGSVAALLAGAMAFVLRDVLDLAEVSRNGGDLQRESQHAVSLIRGDLAMARRVLAASGDSLVIQTTGGDTVRYRPDPAAPDTLQRQAGSSSGALSSFLDSLRFQAHTIGRTKTLEEMVPVPYEVLHCSFEPGDWDSWASSYWCDAWRVEERVENGEWCAQELWDWPACQGFTRAAVRVRAVDHYPPEVDLLLEVYEASQSGYPSRLLARGRISRLDITYDYEWHTADLAAVVSQVSYPSGRYWLVARPDGSGWHTYAGHLQREHMEDCWGGSYPTNQMCYRETNDGGYSWGAGGYGDELFFRLYALQSVDRLTEVTRTVTDTIGVSYVLHFRQGREESHRVGFVALRNR